MMPPYRLTSLEDVRAFARGKRSKRIRALTDFAEKKKLTRPMLLRALPERMELPVYDIREEYRAVVVRIEDLLERDYPFAVFEDLKSIYRDLVKRAPATYDEAVARMLVSVRSVLPAGGKGTPHASATPIADTLDRRTLLAELLTAAFWSYLNTRDALVEAQVADCLRWLLVMDPTTGGVEPRLRDILETDRPDHGEDLQLFHDLHVRKLDHIRRVFLGDMRQAFVDRAKASVLKLPLPANARTHLVQCLRAVAANPFDEKAREVLVRAVSIHGGEASRSEATRLRSIVTNFTEKLRVQSAFDERHFQTGTLDALFEAFRPFLHRVAFSREHLTTGVTLTLYPCKDYHDFLKGEHSGDCTVNATLAAGHLSSPRFLNLRIFRDAEWLGNIYVLDYTATANTVIVDKFQLANSARIVPLRFFPCFVSDVVSVIANSAARTAGCAPGGVRVIAPQGISNYPRIQRSFDEYSLERPRAGFTLSRGDRLFESHGCGSFVVLWPE